MKLFIVTATFFVIAACKKETCTPLHASCHGDTIKPLVITAPYSADTLRYGQLYETTWIGKIPGTTEYAVILNWNDYTTSQSYFQFLGTANLTDCSFTWKVHSEVFGSITNDNCHILFAGNSVPGYVESARFSIRP